MTLAAARLKQRYPSPDRLPQSVRLATTFAGKWQVSWNRGLRAGSSPAAGDLIRIRGGFDRFA